MKTILFVTLSLYFNFSFAQTVDTYATAGTFTWVVPPCVTSVTVRAWGAGGAGGGASATDRNGGGGGGGAYSIRTEAVTPGETLRITVGTGGAGGTGNGAAGGFSQVEHLTGAIVFCRAAGGAGGIRASCSTCAGAGGAGGAIANNIPAGVGFSGGNGGASDANTASYDQSGGGGGGAGSGSNGGNGGTPTSGAAGSPSGGAGGPGTLTTSTGGSNGAPGSTLGGGGGGATTYSSSRTGGAGANGQVTISYIATGCEPPASMFAYSTPGTYTWVVPTCVNFVSVEAWGGGGGGGGNVAILRTSGASTETCTGAGGGGGGGYAARTYAVVPGQSYTIVVGNGGTAGAAGAGSTGSGISTPAGTGGAGQSSTFSGPATVGPGTLTGVGGNGGAGAGGYNTVIGTCILANGASGTGGVGLNGTVNYTGGNGANGLILDHSTDKSGGGGGAAGPGGNGGTAPSAGSVGVATPPAGTGNPPGGNGGVGRIWNTPALNQQNGASGVDFGGGGGGSLIHTSSIGVYTAVGGTGGRGEVRLTYNTACPLPIELSYFEGECSDDTKNFKWTTDSELNNDFFTIEGSSDAKEWVELANQKGAGTSQEKLNYNMTLSNARSYQYFRLKQTDFNGAFTYSNIISVFCNHSNEIVLFPIPAEDVITLKGLNKDMNYSVELADINGKLIKTFEKKGNGNDAMTLDLAGLSSGSYVIHLMDQNNTKQTYKFVKQ
jgi:hypothetical protein